MASKKKTVAKKSANGVSKKHGSSSSDAPNGDVVSAITAQIDELAEPTVDRQVKTQAVLQALRNLAQLIGGVPADAPNTLLAGMIKDVDGIAQNTKPLQTFGIVLADLDHLGVLIPAPVA